MKHNIWPVELDVLPDKISTRFRGMGIAIEFILKLTEISQSNGMYLFFRALFKRACLPFPSFRMK